MGGLVKRWTALDGRLVLQFDIDRDWRPGHAGAPASLVISGPPDPNDVRTVALGLDGETGIDARFASGCYLRGWLRWRHDIAVDGVIHSGIFADIHFGFPQANDHHFEGMMVSWPARNPSPPDPPQPPPPPFDPPE